MNLKFRLVLRSILIGEAGLLLLLTAATAHSQASSPQQPTVRSAQFSSSQDATQSDELAEIVVTGVFQSIEKSKSSVAISTVSADEVFRLQPISAIDLLANVPGVYALTAEGVVNYGNGSLYNGTTPLITARGLAFVQMEEDGLPVYGAAAGSFPASLSGPTLLRSDLTLQRLEVVRGGSAAITGANAPGGLFNYISKTGGNVLSGEVAATYGLQGNGSLPYRRVDFDIGGPLAPGWHFNVGGFYQNDDGAHDAGYTLNHGGQLKANLVKDLDRGFVKVYAKYLDDHNAPTEVIPGVDWNSPRPAPGWTNSSTELAKSAPFLFPTGPDTFGSHDNQNLEHIKSRSIGVQFDYDLGGGWKVNNNLKFSSSSLHGEFGSLVFQENIGDFFPYLLLNTYGKPGTYTWRDPSTGRSAQVLSNTGLDLTILNNNLRGTPGVPGGITLQAAIQSDTVANEWQDQLIFNKSLDTATLGHMDFTIGGYFDHSNVVDYYPNAGWGFATLTPRPQMLDVTLTTPSGQVLQVTNPAGFGAPNAIGAGYQGGKWDQYDVFLADRWQLAGWTLDVGARYEMDRSDAFANSSASSAPIDTGSNLYGNSYAVFGPPYTAVEKYHTLAYSAAINREIDESNVLYLRYTLGKDAPGLLPYANAVDQALQPPIPEKVTQWELGYKFHKPRFSIDVTPYYSVLSKVGVSNILIYADGDSGPFTNGPVFTPPNKTRNVGVELDSQTHFDYGFDLRAALTVQRTKIIDSFNWIQPAGVVGPSNDPTLGSTLVDVNAGNRAQYIPDVMATLTPSYHRGPFLAQVQWQYVGGREANNYNAWVMPAYQQTNITVQWNFTQALSATFIVNNVFDSGGVIDWAAPGNLLDGAIATATYTKAQVLANPNATFSILQIPSRAFFLKVAYKL